MADKESPKVLRIVLFAVLAVALCGYFVLNRSRSNKLYQDVPPGTIYYKGPMKARGSKTGSEGRDTLNPDLDGVG